MEDKDAQVYIYKRKGYRIVQQYLGLGIEKE